MLRTFALSTALLLAPALFAQNEHPQSCVIVKRHVHKFGENMSRLHPHRPFDYVEGDYPPGFKWRSELQKKGGKIVVLSPDYQPADLEDARKQCKSPTPPQDAKPHNGKSE